MRRLRVTLAMLALALALVPAESAACTCMWAGGFFKVSASADAIVRVRVADFHGRNGNFDLAMDVEVIEVLKGGDTGKRLRIWGDNGAYCRPYVSSFPRGTEWIFAVNRLKTTASDPGSRAGDYYINGCGAYWLRVEGDTATGHIHIGSPGEPTQAMPLDAFRREMKARLP